MTGPEDGYEAQARGGLAAYERYLAAMDGSMRQKVALTAAHLLCEGRVADMGMGSGLGSHALAALYPRLEVVGVDIDETIVARAREHYSASNLSFVAGDIAESVFPPEALDGIFDSSVLHHVTSYRGYRYENAADALAAQAVELKNHGVLVVRDFLDPGPAPVFLDIPADDGDDSDDPTRCSTAALLEKFSREFRSLAPSPGCAMERIADGGALSLRLGWRRYRLSHKHAAEFLLRKDYRTDWTTEIQEEYTYFTQDQFEALFARLGLRVLASTPLYNPWIIRNRFAGRCLLHDVAGGAALEMPATNYIIVGERVPSSEGVAFRRVSAAPAPGFLRLEHHRQRSTGKVFDLAARPFATVDVIPFFDLGGLLYVLARTSYPRPIPHGHQSLDGARPASYIAEPLNAIQTDRPLGRTVEETLAKAAGIAPENIRRMQHGTTYYPSPGGVMEEVRSVLVEIEPLFTHAPVARISGFSTSGRVRAIEARQLLRAAQVGGLPDARLELNVYELLHRMTQPRGPWIGEEIRLAASLSVVPTPIADVLRRPQRRAFESTTESARFLRVEATTFEELDAAGRVVAVQTLESVAPIPLGSNTVAVALLARVGDQVVMGVDEDDLPAAQGFRGNSNLVVTPAWRLPADVQTVSRARAWIAQRLSSEYGLSIGEMWELGGAYRPSPGLTPETVFPLAVEVIECREGRRSLDWVPLSSLVAHRAELPDGHLRVMMLRAAHALESQGSPSSER